MMEVPLILKMVFDNKYYSIDQDISISRESVKRRMPP
jgi:hypothetical protein